MFGIALVFICVIVIYGFVSFSGDVARKANLFPVLAAGYFLRLVVQALTRNVQFFSHAAGGDYTQYEFLADMITKLWDNRGLHYITGEELKYLGPTTLPPNLFAFVIYLNGGSTRTGCTAVIALAAALSMLNFYMLAVELGADRIIAKRAMMLLLFSPGFILYTSDMYKDGLVLFLVLGAVGSGLRLTRRFSILHALFGAVCLLGLWRVRYYLVFLTLGPVIVGVSGIGSKSPVRPIFVTVALIIGLIGVTSYTDALGTMNESANKTFETVTNARFHAANQTGGSAVTFDDGGSPYGAMPAKVIYTLFSPFPWMTGSFGLQMGKIDTLIWYYFFYRLLRSARMLWREDKGLLLMFAVFLIPITFVYAVSMANIGLIFRQRMPIITVGILFATLSWRETHSEEDDEAAETTEAGLEPA